MTSNLAASTKERILDATEGLFAKYGFQGTSVRAITSEAGVNLAAVHYHFGSKEALIQAVFSRRLEPLNRERIRRLRESESASGGEPRLEEIIRAFVEPALKLFERPGDGPAMMSLMGRALLDTDGRTRVLIHPQFDEVRRAFEEAFLRALPSLPREELQWRFLFFIGVMIQSLLWIPSLTAACGKPPGPAAEDVVRKLVTFAAAGLSAPPTPPPQGDRS
jgi:AcrR family transcriptional regulator